VTVTVPSDFPSRLISNRIRSAFCSTGTRLMDEQKKPPQARLGAAPNRAGSTWTERLRETVRPARTRIR